MSLVRGRLIQMLSGAILPLLHSEAEVSSNDFSIELEIPSVPQHGDYATNVALGLTRRLRRNPREIASEIVGNIKDCQQIIQRTEIAGPGFINFFIQPTAWHDVLLEILSSPAAYGRQDLGKGKSVQVEFVSANPTGPLHIGHGRGAATGDVLANILGACGYRVEREYYINDAGNQM
ncbi:MAG TPA: arginine--tRNA ligase, partial [Syntrophobacteraceae bacterium]|nr:arginine--tRNA ligase [Syntrophobacteraceae bacterium]